MTRTFLHEFRPPQDSPVAGPDVQLTVQEIEDAGLREVLQTPGAAFGSWAFLETLLQPGAPFVFREPLGQAREVKVALSRLFGRFVARAYLQRYFGLSIFAHLGRQPIVLDGERQIKIVGRARGDLPDWVACTHSLSNLTVAEAKGCHDPSGPARALDRAWKQAERVDVVVRGRRVTIKRLAIATRWGVSTEDGPRVPWLSVHDPIDEETRSNLTTRARFSRVSSAIMCRRSFQCSAMKSLRLHFETSRASAPQRFQCHLRFQITRKPASPPHRISLLGRWDTP